MIFLFSKMTRASVVPIHLRSQWENWALSPGAKRPGREADHPSQSNEKVENEWSYNFTSTLCIHGIH